MNKSTKLLPIILILLTLFAPVLSVHADAAEVLMLTTTTNTASYSNMSAGGSDPHIYTIGMVFNSTLTSYLSKVSLNIYTTNDTSDAYCNVGLYSVAGNYGTNAYGLNLLAESTPVTVGSLGGSANWVNWTMTSTVQLTAGTYYAVQIYYTEINNGETSDHDIRWAGPSSSAYGGNQYFVNNETGYAYSVNDLGLKVYTDEDGSPATPAPLPTGGSYTYTDTDELINTLAGYLVPLLVFLLPALILGWVTKWQKWPILIGLAIGSGLSYLFLGPQYLWLVILVTIGIGASAYQSSRGPG